MITAGILAAAAADVFLVELEDGWRYAICLQVAEDLGIQHAIQHGMGDWTSYKWDVFSEWWLKHSKTRVNNSTFAV